MIESIVNTLIEYKNYAISTGASFTLIKSPVIVPAITPWHMEPFWTGVTYIMGLSIGILTCISLAIKIRNAIKYKPKSWDGEDRRGQ